jgi:hypothetical protein
VAHTPYVFQRCFFPYSLAQADSDCTTLHGNINDRANAAVPSQPLVEQSGDEKATSQHLPRTICHFPTWQDKMRREVNIDPSKSWADQESDDEQLPAASHDHVGGKVNNAAVSSKPPVKQLVDVKVSSRTLRAAFMCRTRLLSAHLARCLPDVATG